MSDQMIGVVAAGEIAVGLVRGHEVSAPIRTFPAREGSAVEGGRFNPEEPGVAGMPMESIAETIATMIRDLCQEHGATPAGVGIGFPGIIRNGVIEESPNLKQAKGAKLAEMVTAALDSLHFPLPVSIFNDADVTAAGMAATRGQLERFIRVWTLGNGIGFGRYPRAEGVWEGGHMVVSLDPKESYCGCGGRGHLEGIMGPGQGSTPERSALLRIRGPLASRARRRHGQQHPYGRPRQVFPHRSQRPVCPHSPAQPVSA